MSNGDIDGRRPAMRSPVIAALGAVMVLAVGVLGSGGTASGASSAGAGVAPDPADFSSPVPNAYFPLEPGTVSNYRGREGKDRLTERLTITDETKVIQGIATTVVKDVVYANGLLDERTTDWYANDNDGNVWYFGEATATYDEHGNVITTEGSWQAGVDGAVAGTIMPAHPMPTDAYRQEFYRGHAEDQAWIVQNAARVDVAYGKLDRVVRSVEWTRLEPGVVSKKFYAPGLGIVREGDVAGGDEFLELVDVSKA
jgi:hypothetical protein